MATNSNKELLKLENEFRNELPKYREKPKITAIPKPGLLTKKVSKFLEATSKQPTEPQGNSSANQGANVEMDLYISPEDD